MRCCRELSRRLGIAAPDRQARHHAMKWGKGTLRWERHTEFSTYLWEGPLADEAAGAADDSPFGNGFSPPGTVISGIRLEIRKWTPQNEKLIAGFDPASLCYSLVENGKAAVVTDFRQDGDGLTQDPGARPRHVAGPHRRAGAAADRDRDLPHACHARPAAGAVAVGARRAASRTGWREITSRDAGHRTARQPGAACRTHRTCRRARGGCGRQPLPLRRQPRL